MNILIGGGSGFIGRELAPVLLRAGHLITVIGRDKNKISQLFSNTVTAISWDQLFAHDPSHFDAIINLTGANIADHRWTEKTKATLLSSRIDSVTTIIDWCKRSTGRKPHLYNASAVGYYGLQQTIPHNQLRFSEQDGLTVKVNPICYWSQPDTDPYLAISVPGPSLRVKRRLTSGCF